MEPWAGVYTDASLSISQRSNYGMREEAMAIKRQQVASGTPATTAMITHGANPGLVSYFLKRAMLNIAKDRGISLPTQSFGEEDGEAENKAEAPDCLLTKTQWCELARSLGLQAIHIAERDTQVAATPRPKGCFTNTWSVDGFVSEGCQPAELGFGTHERALPADGHRHEFGCDAAIYLNQPGASTRVRSWTPLEGPYHGFLITHNESISIADFLTLRDATTGEAIYRPTVHYAYHPCNDAVLSLHELAGKNWAQPASKLVMMSEIVDGNDELGVLLMGVDPQSGSSWAYWYGSQLSVHDARRMAEFNSATSLQVAATCLSGMVWAMKHPNMGILEPDEVPFEDILKIADPYLQPLVGVYTDWTPTQNRGVLFPEAIDLDSPFQFKNVRV